MSDSLMVTDARWWRPEYRDDRHTRMLSVVHRIVDRQSHWRKRDLLHATLYGNLPILGLAPHAYGMLEQTDDRLILNLCKAKVDTYQSMICRSKPKPMFLSSDGTWGMMRRAKGLNRWAEAKLRESGVYDTVFPLIVLDTGVFDFGCTKTFIDGVHGDDWSDADVCFERVFPWELVVDDVEAQGGAPRSLYQRKWVDKGVLESMYPSFKAEIRDCPYDSGDGRDAWGRDDTSEQVMVTEGWHLPSGPKAKDGRRVVAIRTAALADEQYDLSHHPIRFLHRSNPPVGIRGTGIVHELRPLQIALNQAYIDSQDAIAMMSRPKWMVSRGANVLTDHLDDDIGTIVEFDGPIPPTVYAPTSLSPEVAALRAELWERADELIGISKFASSAVVPSQLKSGKAIEAHSDVQDGRFTIASQKYEQHVCTVTEDGIDLARTIAGNNPKYAARYVRKTYVQVVDFRSVDLKRDEYVMQAYPTNALSSSPGQRYDQLVDMLDRGAINLDQFRDLLDFPDIESETNRLNAGKQLVDKLIERYLEAEDTEADGLYIAPEPLWPLEMMSAEMQMAADLAQVDGAPEGNVSLCRRWVAQAKSMALPPPAPPGAPAGPPPAPGGPPPPMPAA